MLKKIIISAAVNFDSFQASIPTVKSMSVSDPQKSHTTYGDSGSLIFGPPQLRQVNFFILTQIIISINKLRAVRGKKSLEHRAGFEPASSAWKAEVFGQLDERC